MMSIIDRLLAHGMWFFWLSLSDNGGRRSGLDRRVFACSKHIPERRAGKDRRAKADRRHAKGRSNMIESNIRTDW
jgi:hypothetical protein